MKKAIKVPDPLQMSWQPKLYLSIIGGTRREWAIIANEEGRPWGINIPFSI